MYRSTVVVSPTGTPKENGAALLTAVATAGGGGLGSPFVLVKIEPGLYDIGESTLVARPNMSLEGSGRNLTIVLCHGGLRGGAPQHHLRGPD